MSLSVHGSTATAPPPAPAAKPNTAPPARPAPAPHAVHGDSVSISTAAQKTAIIK